MPERLASYEELLAFLDEEKAPFRHDPATQVVQLSMRAPPLDGPLYLRWEKGLPYVQIIAPLLMDVPEARAGEVVDAVARVNHAITRPGFGYDFAKRFIYFRLTLPVETDGIRAELVKRMLLGAVANARDFLGAMRAVVDGQPGGRVLELVVAREAERRVQSDEDPAATFKE